MGKVVPIDFEYHSSNERNLHLVCCSLMYKGKVYEYWLNDGSDKEKLIRNLNRINSEGLTLLCFNATAEGRALLSLGLNVCDFKWVCLNAEWKMLTNHYHKYSYGDQYVDGKYITTSPPRNIYNMTEEQKKHHNFSKVRHNLLACTYKMLGSRERDSEYKTKMRDIILTQDYMLIEDKKREIQEYCTADIYDLPKIFERIINEYDDFFGRFTNREQFWISTKEILWRGETMARAAIVMAEGYPVDVGKLVNFAGNIPNILRELIEDINSQFDWDLFSPNKSAHGYKQNQKEWKKFIAYSGYSDGWLKTNKGDYSLALEAFEKKFSWRHDYPRGNFYAQALRYLKTKQALNGFNTDPSKKSIFQDLGSDGRVRAYLNPYGSQSARYQPPSTSFMFLKPAWTRTLVHPQRTKAICGIDYKSEEALIGALNSNDEAMLAAYISGDVYLDFAKRAGAIPQDGTKAEYKKERDLFKATYLGISYLMGAKALAKKLTADTGNLYTEAQAKELIEAFYKAYPKYKKYLDGVVAHYSHYDFLKLQDGWVMFGDNDNFRSVSNMPIQGMGSCILRKAIQLAQDKGLNVIIPLHDALYIEYEAGKLEDIKTLADCMVQAFVDCYPNNPKADVVQLDIETWSDSYEPSTIDFNGIEIHKEKIHIDPRGRAEYERYRKYFEQS